MVNRRTTAGLAVAAAVLIAGASAAEEPEDGWSDSAELSYVVTAGNSETSTFAFKNTLAREWEKSGLTVRLGALRAESKTTSRTAVGTPAAFGVVERSTTDVTAENYFLNGRYDREITDRLVWYVGAGWDRNRPSGIQNRTIGEAGVGHTWYDTDELKFETLYAATYTRQDDVVAQPGREDSFAGVRFSWDYQNRFGANATYANVLVLDDNLDDTSRWRGDMTNSLAVNLSSRLALKAGLQWRYENEPAFRVVALENPLGTPTGLTVPVELDNLDSVFTVSLVFNL